MAKFEINTSALLPFHHPEYCHPSHEDVRALMGLMDWRGSQIAAMVGVDSRCIRRWTGDERVIPYSAWRLLLINAGLAEK